MIIMCSHKFMMQTDRDVDKRDDYLTEVIGQIRVFIFVSPMLAFRFATRVL